MMRRLLTATCVVALVAVATAHAGEGTLYFGGIPDETIEGTSGVVLGEVVRGSPAEEAGLRAGDRIVKVGTSPVQSVEELRDALLSQPAGDPIEITYLRDGDESHTRVVMTPSW